MGRDLRQRPDPVPQRFGIDSAKLTPELPASYRHTRHNDFATATVAFATPNYNPFILVTLGIGPALEPWRGVEVRQSEPLNVCYALEPVLPRPLFANGFNTICSRNSRPHKVQRQGVPEAILSSPTTLDRIDCGYGLTTQSPHWWKRRIFWTIRIEFPTELTIPLFGTPRHFDSFVQANYPAGIVVKRRVP